MTETKLLDEYCGLLKGAGAKIGTDALPAVTENDLLIVVDMQLDFLPGGSLGVTEGDSTIPVISDLVSKFAAKGAPVYFTRDYHPADHCSFSDKGGPFNAHCVQGSPGATFHPDLEKAAQPLLKDGKVGIVYKGFCKDTDSFGGFPYAEAEFKEGRVANTGMHASCWTGAFTLYSSCVQDNMSAPPDVMAILDKVDFETAIAQKIKDKSTARVFVVGLALDFCVLDTACNAAAVAGFKDVTILVDGTRAVHIGAGSIGSGFASTPESIIKKTEQVGVKLAMSPSVQF